MPTSRPRTAAPRAVRGWRSRHPLLRRSLLLGACGLLPGILFPQTALAHGIVGRANLPIPTWLFSWAAAIVLVLSFVALSTLWRTPQLQQARPRRLIKLPQLLDWVASLVGVALFALVLYSGFAGSQVASANFSVTFVYVVFWVGLPVLSVLFGDVFAALSPWRTSARVLSAVVRLLRRGTPSPLLRYPDWLGNWPAVAGLVGFAWLELVYELNLRDHPATIAALSLGYFLAMLAGMMLFGVEQWDSQADGFRVYLNMVSRLAPICRDQDGVLCLRRPLSGITQLPIRPGTITVICTLIGTTTFDGLSNGAVWRKSEPSLQSVFAELGFGPTPAAELTYSVGLVLCILLILAIYRLGIRGVASVSARYDTKTLSRTFAHTLVPIAFAYALAHYFSLLLWQGQAVIYLFSDPLGDGSNILGTAGYQIDYHVISYAGIWYVQVAALLGGHVAGLMLAHDRALVLYKGRIEAAVRSQYWLLAVMVAFTSFGLWLLSSVGT
jgi:hypothetical protein